MINRAYWAIPVLNDSKGNPTNAVFGFVNMLVKIIETHRPDYIGAAFDLHAPTFRHKKFPEYKAGRRPMPDELKVQMPIIKSLLLKMNVKILEKEGYEADDIIGTLSKKERAQTIIFTGDKDALQLVDECTSVHLTKRGITETEIYTPEYLQQVYGFEPSKIVDLKALMGDSSDNIPGVPGVGEKTAIKLLSDYKSLDGVYLNSDSLSGKLGENIRAGRESAYISYDLATICTVVPLEYRAEDLCYSFPFEKSVYDSFSELGFSSLTKKNIFIFKSGAADNNMPAETPAAVKDHAPHTAVVSSYADAPVSEKFILRSRQEFADVKESGSFACLLDNETIQFAFEAEKNYELSLRLSLLEESFDYAGAVAALKKYFENPNINKILFDYKAVKTRLKDYGVEILGKYEDIQLYQYCIDSNAKNGTVEDVLGNFGLSSCVSAPAAAMLFLAEHAGQEIKADKLYNEIEKPLQDVLYKMERYGFKIDTSVMDGLSAEFCKKLDELTKAIYLCAGEVFNINSPKQLGVVLFEKLQLQSKLKTKSKQLSTSNEVLTALEDSHPLIPLILEYRTLSKLNGTYVEGLKKQLTGDNILHTVFKQTVTATGRLSSVEPNLQNIPIRDEFGRRIRKFFVSREGYRLISADYSQIELRLLAHCSGCKALIEGFKNDEDLHTRTASDVFGVPVESVSKDLRRSAKAVNFGIIYGMSDFGLSKELGITTAKAHEYITKYFEAYPEVKAYLDGVKESARSEKLVRTMFGRVRRMPDINNSKFLIRAFNERAAINMPLQGAAADLIKIAMLKLDAKISELKLDAHILCQVHDELILEAAEGQATEAAALLKSVMESAAVLSVPLKVDCVAGDNWFDL